MALESKPEVYAPVTPPALRSVMVLASKDDAMAAKAVLQAKMEEKKQATLFTPAPAFTFDAWMEEMKKAGIPTDLPWE